MDLLVYRSVAESESADQPERSGLGRRSFRLSIQTEETEITSLFSETLLSSSFVLFLKKSQLYCRMTLVVVTVIDTTRFQIIPS